MHKPISRVRLAAAQSDEARFERRRLDSAFLSIVRALPCRPEPRAAWDNRARRDQRVPHPSADTIALCRGAMLAAHNTGDVDIVRTTRLEVENYFDLCKSAAITLPLPTLSTARPLPALGFHEPYLALIREGSEAIVAAAEAQVDPNETTIDHARREARELVDAGLAFLKHCFVHSDHAGQRRAIS